MNPNFLPGENFQDHRERLEREMDAEVVDHKEHIARALLSAGHTVEPPEDLAQDYMGQSWTVDGHHIEVKSRKMYRGPGFHSTPSGSLRITVGPYNNKKVFVKKTSAKELKNFPKGFDYDDIASTMVRIIAEERERVRRDNEERRRGEENDRISQSAARRLMKEFGIKSPYGLDFIPEPLRVDHGRKELGLVFNHLNEEQAHHILCAARDCGALKEDEE